MSKKRVGVNCTLNDLGADVATPTLVSVKVVEIGNDDRNRKCDGEYAGDDAQRADHLAPNTHRCDVTVADRRHGNDGPPEGARDWGQLGFRLTGFSVVRRRAEDHHGNQQEKKNMPSSWRLVFMVMPRIRRPCYSNNSCSSSTRCPPPKKPGHLTHRMTPTILVQYQQILDLAALVISWGFLMAPI